MQVHSFAPLSSASAEILILGSMPGKASLAAGEYYAHPRNYFWPIMGSLLGFPSDIGYGRRCETLTGHRIALWDVLKACTRNGSLDTDIIEASIVPNDFVAFLRSHSRIRSIFFNGSKAESIYRRHIYAHLPADLAAIQMTRLPSTSPANASIPLAVKLSQWRAVTGKGTPTS